jgi:hypothetical protein
MQGIAQVGSAITLEVNFNPSLDVGLLVYNCSTGTPVQYGAIIPMVAVDYTLYAVNFTLPSVGTWLFQKNVYTDNTYTVIDNTQPTGSESILVVDFAGILLNATLNNYMNLGSVGAAIAMAAKQPVDFIGFVD